MIQVQLKLILRPSQERRLERWLWHLTGVWNWAIRKIELDAKGGVYHTAFGFTKLLKGHYLKMGIPVVVMEGVTDAAVLAWRKCFDRKGGQPRLKGRRNRMNSIPFKRPLVRPTGDRITVFGFKGLKFHRQDIPEGRIKASRIVKRASGWYLCLFIDAEPRRIDAVGAGAIGIDPGFSSLLTLSTGEKVSHPRELEVGAVRLSQAQRGLRRGLTARLLERQGARRRNRNHHVSRRLVAENALIAFSVDHHSSIARRFGKSVTSSSHYQLRQMLSYKCRAGGRRLVEVASRNSTRACSACLALTGPTGWLGLKVRQWVCPTCGVEHDRDTNAAVNTLNAALGMSVKGGREAASGIAP